MAIGLRRLGGTSQKAYRASARYRERHGLAAA